MSLNGRAPLDRPIVSVVQHSAVEYTMALLKKIRLFGSYQRRVVVARYVDVRAEETVALDLGGGQGEREARR